MPSMTYEPQAPSNDRSSLPQGWCPAFLLAITEEVTPSTWMMYAKSPKHWRWAFAVWPSVGAMMDHAPERQSAISSKAFNAAKGQAKASKCYTWHCELLNKRIEVGEEVNLDPLMPIPCRVKIERKEDYANIVDLERWPEGQQYLTPGMRQSLASVGGQQAQSPPKGPEPWTQPPPSTAAPSSKPSW